MVPLVAFAGRGGAGKTTFAEQVVRALKAAGLRVGVAKHTHHHIEIDQPGKDSWRYAQAGSDVVVVGTRSGSITFDYSGGETELLTVARQLEGRVDILIAEGYKTEAVPKIAIVRRAVSRELPCAPSELVALVSDMDLGVTVPRFEFSQPQQVAEYLQELYGLDRRESGAGALHSTVRLPATAWPKEMLRHSPCPSVAGNAAADGGARAALDREENDANA